MSKLTKLFLACLIASLGTAFAQTNPMCYLPGYLPFPAGPSLGLIASTTNPITGAPAVITPGQWVHATGVGFVMGGADVQSATADSSKPLPTSLAGTEIMVDGYPSAILYFGVNGEAIPFAGVVEFQPKETAGTASAKVWLRMTEPDGTVCDNPYSLQSAVIAVGNQNITAVRRPGFVMTVYFGGTGHNPEVAQAFVEGSNVEVTYSDQNEVTFRVPGRVQNVRIWTPTHGEVAFEMPGEKE